MSGCFCFSTLGGYEYPMAVVDGTIEIQKDDFADALGYALREYLRENLDDPESGNRGSGDKFIWFNNVSAVLASQDHKLPFIALSKELGGVSNDLGHNNSGGFKRQPYTIQLVYDSAQHSDLIDKACQLITEIHNDTGSGPDYGYNMKPVSDPEVTSQPEDRTTYSDHEHQEQSAEVQLQGVYGG